MQTTGKTALYVLVPVLIVMIGAGVWYHIYGYRAGECFALAQGGPFASPEIAKLVNAVRDLGYTGVGQSSWGPTVFVVTSDERSASSLVSRLQQHDDYQHYDFTIAPANNTGAAIQLTE